MNLHDTLKSIIEEAEKDSIALKKNFLMEDDPFGGDADGDDAGEDPFGGDDAGGGDDGGDPFGGDDSGDGDDSFDSEGGEDSGEEGEDGEESEEEKDKAEELDLEGHEDDPEFTKGSFNKDDVTLPNEPAAKTMFDVEEVMNNVAKLVSTLKEDQLVEYEQVKKCVELIFNGKKLNPEDLEFNNLQNAIFLIANIEKNLDIKTRAYLTRKIKEPLILKRDEIKQDIAKQKGELNTTRDAVIKLDTIKI